MTKQGKGDYVFDVHGADKRFSEFDDRIRKGLHNRKGGLVSDLIPENKELVLAFKRKVWASGKVKAYRILKYETFFRNYDRLLGKPFGEATREDLETVISKVKEGDWKDATKNDFLRLLKRYYKVAAGMEDEDDHPALVKWIKIDKEKPEPLNFSELPTWEDVLELCRHTHNARDRALIKLHYECGNRVGETLSLRIKNIEPTEHGLYVNVMVSKTALRKVFVRLCESDVLAWLEDHPLKNDKEAPLFVGLNKDKVYYKALSYRYVYKMLDRVKAAAGLEKNAQTHAMRKGSASAFAGFLSHAEMCAKYGWKINSPEPQRYITVGPEAIRSKVLTASGIEESPGNGNMYARPQKQTECFFCKKLNDAERKTCWNCKRLLDLSRADEEQKTREKIADVIAGDEELIKLIKRHYSKKGI